MCTFFKPSSKLILGILVPSLTFLAFSIRNNYHMNSAQLLMVFSLGFVAGTSIGYYVGLADRVSNSDLENQYTPVSRI